MRLAMVGLGKMGQNMTRRLLRGGHEVVALDRSRDAVAAAGEGAIPATSMSDAVSKLAPPRIVWLMVPAGAPVDENVDSLCSALSALSPYVEDSGEGRWTVEQSIEAGIPLPSIALSLYMRFFSRQENSFAMRMLAALRNEFGGHAVKAAPFDGKKG